MKTKQTLTFSQSAELGAMGLTFAVDTEIYVIALESSLATSSLIWRGLHSKSLSNPTGILRTFTHQVHCGVAFHCRNLERMSIQRMDKYWYIGSGILWYVDSICLSKGIQVCYQLHSITKSMNSLKQPKEMCCVIRFSIRWKCKGKHRNDRHWHLPCWQVARKEENELEVHR